MAGHVNRGDAITRIYVIHATIVMEENQPGGSIRLMLVRMQPTHIIQPEAKTEPCSVCPGPT